ncbi:MAG TPA: Rap1a/Tai family immunity protein, partial [Gemmataceae bacterium]|nr:Rap1a/Tai family immunity protein [Gemmataceae bacterium]
AATPSLSPQDYVKPRLALRVGICLGIVSSIFGVGHWMDQERVFCPPPGANNKQALQIVVKRMEDRPQLMDGDLRILALIWFQEIWPCPSTRK